MSMIMTYLYSAKASGSQKLREEYDRLVRGLRTTTGLGAADDVSIIPGMVSYENNSAFFGYSFFIDMQFTSRMTFAYVY